MGGQISGDVLCGHDRQDLVHLPELRVQAGEDAARPPAVGMGLRLQRGLGLPGDRCVRQRALTRAHP